MIPAMLANDVRPRGAHRRRADARHSPDGGRHVRAREVGVIEADKRRAEAEADQRGAHQIGQHVVTAQLDDIGA